MDSASSLAGLSYGAAMAKSDAYESAWLDYALNNIVGGPLANLGSGVVATTTAGSLLAAFTTDAAVPDDTVTSAFLLANEAAYTDYARVSIARSSGTPEWTVSGTGSAVNANNLTWPQANAAYVGSETLEYVFILDSTGTNVMYYGQLTSPITVSAGTTPQIDAGDLTITED